MNKNYYRLPFYLMLISYTLSSCGLPAPSQIKSPTASPTPASVMVASTTTPQAQLTPTTETSGSPCDNDYFPSDDDATWTFAGNNSKTGDFTRTDTVTDSTDNGFTITTQLTKVSYTQEFTCTDAGLINLNPVSGELSSLLSGPSGTVVVNRNFASGITIPKDLAGAIGQSWQQVFGWEAINSDTSNKGEFTTYFTAMGLEVVHVPPGSFDAMRIDARIEIEIGTYQKTYGTYTTSIWLGKDVGLLKSEGSMKMPGVDFTDTLELISYDSP